MKRKNLKKPMISALEQRILFDGAAVATAVDVLDNSSFSTTSSPDSTSKNDVTSNNAENSVHEVQAVQSFEKDRKEVAFVDITVKDYQTLVDGIGAGVETYLVSSFDEINSILQNQKDIDAIHILSHGSTGEITVGNDVLNNGTLDENAQLLETIKNSLSESGDILLYGCNVASDGNGEGFINSIAQITQADVAASDDVTGSSTLGGDWVLEKSTGIIDTNDLNITNYDSTFMANQVFNWGTINNIYVRPNSTSYVWTWGTGSATDSNNAWFTGQITSVSMANVPGFSWYLDRGHFEYSSNGGSSWTTYNVTDTSYDTYVSTANTLWRFVDTQTNTTNDHIGFYYNVQGGSSAVGGSGIELFVDSAPTDITSSITNNLLVSDTPLGSVITTLTPVDTGLETLGKWVIDSQSNSGLFSLQNDSSTGNTAKLVLNSSLSSLTEGAQVNVVVHYYDAYQTDSSGNPITGEGVTKTLTFTVKGASHDLDFSDDITVNDLTNDTADQSQPSITTLSNGNFVVTWSDTTNGGVYSQIYDNTGVAQGTKITIDSSSTATKPTIESLSNNKIVVVYTDLNTYDILYKIVDLSNNSILSSGTIESYSVDANSTQIGGWDGFSDIGVSSNSNGTSFNVTWNLSDWTTVKTASYSDSGTLSGSISTLTTSGYYPESIILSNGDIVNISGDGNTYAGFNILINDNQIGTTIGNTSDPVSVTTLSGGGFVVTWDSANYTKIYAQIFDNSGSSTSSIFEVNTGGTAVSLPKISALSDGGFTIVWSSGNLDGSGTSIQGRRFDSTGTAIDTNEFQVNEYRFANQEYPVITPLANGAFAVAWVDSYSGKTTGSDIEARVLLVTAGPTVSVATATYNDSVANDTFANTTGTISATASNGSITGYGISSGTNGSTTIGSLTYDVSKAGTYGTLYVKSSDGSYVYVPTSDSVINATSTTVTDTFIIEATDSVGTKGNTLTITINGLNDTPTVANIIGNQTATQDSVYNFQFPSNVFSDVDSGDIQTYTAQLVDSNGNLINGGILPTWLTFTSGTRTFSGTPANADVGILNVKVTAIDGSNAMASNTFSLTIANVNDAPSGSVIISGIVKQGETLTASNTIADADGLGTITYQWYADNVLITGATNSTYILTQNEVDKIITVKASYTDGQNTNETVISSATTSIVNVNDAPTVSSENIDVTVPFGNDYVKNISTLFNDIDNSDTLIFEAINLPSGLSINPLTGVISGKPTQSGNFVITIKGTDSGSPALSVSRTYTMLVLAPAQMTVDTPTVNTPTESNTIPTEKNTNISLNTFTDNTNFGIFNYGTNGNNNVENIVEGFISNKNPQDNPPQNTTETPTPNNTPTDNGKGMIQSNVDLNVSANGQISFNQGNQDSFSIVGITIEDIKVENGNLEIKVVDTNLSQNFIVTQSDGTSLPTGLSFNPKTGTISGIIPDNLEKLEISIKAINPDGTTKVLNLKLDLKQLKQKTQAEAESFIGLKEQIALENQKNDGYGSYLTKLFA